LNQNSIWYLSNSRNINPYFVNNEQKVLIKMFLCKQNMVLKHIY